MAQQPLAHLAAHLGVDPTEKNSLTLGKTRYVGRPVVEEISRMLDEKIDPLLQEIAETAAERDAELGGGPQDSLKPYVNGMSVDKGTARTISLAYKPGPLTEEEIKKRKADILEANIKARNRNLKR